MANQFCMTPAPVRFWAKVQKTEGCWLWTGCENGKGYGLFYHSTKRVISAHRWAYEEVNGPIPDGLVLDHLCRTPRCVNPAHLEAVTQRVNSMRGLGISAKMAQQTHCKRAHPFSGDNLRLIRKKYGTSRECRACMHMHAERYRAKQRNCEVSK